MHMTSRWTHKFELKPNSWVFVPSEFSVQEGQNIKEQIENKWQPSAAYYHLKAGGHVAALKSHIKNTYFLRLDIENFFGSINRSRITRTLKPYFGYETAREIAINSTVVIPDSSPKKYMLPFGFIQSPILASICLEKSSLGKFCNTLLGKSGVTVTIYMENEFLSAYDGSDSYYQRKGIASYVGTVNSMQAKQFR